MSDWKKEAATRRDIRRALDPNEVPKKAGSPSKKDTKKWCRGKQGVEHKPVARDYNEVKQGYRGHALEGKVAQGWKILMCSECGKELDYWMPLQFRGETQKEPPDWAK